MKEFHQVMAAHIEAAQQLGRNGAPLDYDALQSLAKKILSQKQRAERVEQIPMRENLLKSMDAKPRGKSVKAANDALARIMAGAK